MNIGNFKPSPARNIFTKFLPGNLQALFVLCCITLSAAAQQVPNTGKLQFITDTSGFMSLDRNGNPIDPGRQQYIIAPGSQSVNSPVISLPFQVHYMGMTYTSFLVNTNGCMVLSPSQVVTFTPNIANNYASVNSQYALLAPFWDALSTPAANGIRYVVSGSAPYRSLTVEWMVNPQNAVTSAGYDMHFQLRLYETTNIVEYVYGRMRISRQTASPVTASIGLSVLSASADSSFVSVMRTDSLYITRLLAERTASQSLVNRSTPGNIEGLHSETEGSRTRIAFVPEPIMLPGNLQAFNVTANEALLYWDDNSTDESGFRTCRVKPGELEYDTLLGAGVTFRALAGLLPGSTYRYQVQAYNLYTSALSNVVTFRTSDADTLTAQASGNWNDTATWGGRIPDRNTVVIIPAAFGVTLNVSQAYCHYLQVEGALTFADNALAKRLYVNYDVVNTGRISVHRNPTFNSITNEIVTGRSVINNGVLDLHYANSSYTSAATLRFTGDEDAYLTGNGDTTNLYAMICEKKSATDSLNINPVHLTLRSTAAGMLSAGSLFSGNIHTGIISVGGTFALQNQLVSSNVFDTETGKRLSVILDNPNLDIRFVTGDITLRTNTALALKQGRLTVTGSLVLSSLSSLTVAGGEIAISGQLKNSSSAQPAVFSQTGGLIAANGIAMNAASNVLNLEDGLLVSKGNTQLLGDLTVSRFGKHITRFGSAGQPVQQISVSGSYAGVFIDSLVNTPVITKLVLNGATNISGRLFVGANDTIDAGNFALSLYADTIMIDGALKSNDSGRLRMAAAGAQTLTGAGKIRAATLEIAKDDQVAAVTLHTVNPVEVMHLDLFGGRIVNSKKLLIGAAGANSNIRIARENTISTGGILDTFPVYAAGARTFLSYNNEPVSRTSSFEIPADRKVSGLFCNNTEGIVLAGGHLEVTDTLALMSGRVVTAENSTLYFTGTTNGQALYAAPGVFVSGPLARRIPAEMHDQAYLFPVGADAANPILFSGMQVNTQAVTVRALYSSTRYEAAAEPGLINLDTTGYWQVSVPGHVGGFDRFTARVYHDDPSPLTQLALARSNSQVLRTTDVFTRAGGRINYYTDSLRSVTVSPSATQDTFYYFTKAELVPDTFTRNLYTVGEGKDFESLTELAGKLGVTRIDSTVIFEIAQEYNTENEQFPVAFEQMLYTKSNHPKKAMIRLAKNVTGIVTGNTGAVLPGHALINLYGTDSLEVDGMGYDALGLPTGVIEWTWKTGTATLQTPVLRFSNDASYNTIRSVNITGNNNNAASASVLFDATQTDITGNDENTIIACNLASAASSQLAYSHIASKGIAGDARNDANHITGNRISGFTGSGVNIPPNSAGSGWTIEANHFFQEFTAAYNALAINFVPGPGSGRHLISRNVIGGTLPEAAGASWTFSGAGINTLIMLNTDPQEETVFSDNRIGNYNQSNTLTTSGARLIQVTGGNVRVAANRIGGPAAGETITIGGRGTSAMITSAGTTGQFTAAGNIITNINQSVAGSTTNRLRGISLEGTLPSAVSGNTLYNMTGRGANTDSRDASLVGIYVQGASSSVRITGNTLYDFNMLSTGCVTAISNYSPSAGEITGNNIYDINNASTGTTRFIMGINIENGSWSTANNKIVITNEGNEGRAISIQGLRISSGGTNRNTIAHNTVYIGGASTVSNFTTNASYAFVQAMGGADVTVLNNLFINTRGTTFNHHMAAYVVASAAYSSDFNVYYAPSATVVAISNVPGTYAAYRTAFGTDASSVSGKLPAFTGLPGAIMPGDSLRNCFMKGLGTAVPGLERDFGQVLRHAMQPDPGADEFSYTHALPAAPVLLSGNDTLCAGASRTLYVSQPLVGGDIEWFTGAAGGEPVFTGTDFTTGAIQNDTVFYAQLSAGECNSYRVAIPVTVKPLPALLVTEAPESAICGGNKISLTVQPAAGSTVSWFTDSIGGTPVASGDRLLTGALYADTAFYAEAANGICNPVRIRIPVTVNNSQTLLPPATDTLVHGCLGFPVMLKASGAVDYNWFEGNSPVVISNDSLLHIAALTGNLELYVAAANGACTSAKVQVKVVADTLPDLLQVDTAVNVCGSKPFNVKLNITHGTLQWFTGADVLEQPFYEGNNLSIPGLSADSVFYYEVANGTCPRTDRRQIRLKPALVATPVTDAISAVCANAPVTLTVINANTETAAWYASSAATSPVYEGLQLITGNLASDTAFYVEFQENGCTSARVPVAVDVVETVVAPVLVSANAVCSGTPGKLIVNSPAPQVNWYATAGLPDVLSNDPEFTTGLLASDTVFYVTSVYGSCQSARVPVKITIKAAPQPPLLAPAGNVCAGTSVRLEASGSDTIRWFATANSTNALNRGTVFTTPKLNANTTYYLETDNGGCRSKRIALAVPVTPAPQLPVIEELNIRTCYNERLLLKARSAVSVNWYATAAGAGLLHRDSLYLTEPLRSDTVFYAESFDGLCRSERVAVPVAVLNYLGNFSVALPDSAILGEEIGISSAGPQSSIYSWEFGSGASLSGASGQGPFRVSYQSAGEKEIRVRVTRRSGSLSCDTLIVKYLNVIDTATRTGLTRAEDLFASFSVYPNPASNVLHIGLAMKHAGKLHVVVYDLTGRPVWERASETTSEYSETIDVDALSSGLYFVRATHEGGAVQTQKVIIE